MNINDTFKQPSNVFDTKGNFNEPLKISNIDVNNLVYSKIKKSNNKKIILTKYNKLNFVFQTPTLLTLPRTSTTSIEVALVGKEKSKVNRFLNFLNKLEMRIKSDAQEYVDKWFDLNNNNINFQNIVRESDVYSTGTIKLKLIDTHDFKTKLELNTNGYHKRINNENIPTQSWCKMILECYAIWINSDNDFGIFFRPILMSFTPKQDNLYNYNFIDSDSDNEMDVLDTEITSRLNPSVMVPVNNELLHVMDNIDQSSSIDEPYPNIINTNEDKLFININPNKLDIETLVNHLELENSSSTISSRKIKNALEEDNLVQNDIISTSSSDEN
jgi:hypothetical protein